MSRKEETKNVKNELKKYNIIAKVRHGKGTAWGWLEIIILEDNYQKFRELEDKTMLITQQITGRKGEHSGKIIITQN